MISYQEQDSTRRIQEGVLTTSMAKREQKRKLFHRNPLVGVCSVNIYRMAAWPWPFLKISLNHHQIWSAHSVYYLLKRIKRVNYTNGLTKEIKMYHLFNYQNSIFYCLLLSADLIFSLDRLLSVDSHEGGFMKNIL